MTMTMRASHTGTAKALPGVPFPLGAQYDGTGTNFSVFSEVAERIELCLFEEDGRETKINMTERDGYNWHEYLTGVGPGQQYGFRVYGPWDPPKGIRCCPNKLLLDPNAKAISGSIQWSDALFPYRMDKPDAAACSSSDDARLMMKSVVTNPYFNWNNEYRSHMPLEDTVIYELHVKGFTKRHPAIPPELRGTYAGVAHPAAIEYLKSLGITAVELMPVHQFVHDRTLIDKGLRNYWGYNSISYFAPHNEYSSSGDRGQQVQEFKQMVYNLHEAGIEVILDVVYNHTAEGNHLGPILSYKGIDNPAYYRLVEDDPQYYMDYTGTGNSLNMRHPVVLQLIMDSLRYWITEMHVDGFRFDLAATLARELKDVDRLSAFFDIIHQDPVINQVKLIAEPWDVGEGGYQVGRFPVLWSEWNGIYRDTMRDYWRETNSTLGQFASRLTGSSDLYENTGRKPRQRQLHHGPRRIHSARSGDVRAEAQRSQPGGQQGRHRRQPLLQLRRRGRDRRSGDQRRAQPPGAQFPHHPAAVPGRSHDPGRRRDRKDAERQQQCLLPGQRADLVRLGARRREPEGIHHPADRAPPGSSGVPSPGLVPGPVDPRLGGAR